MCIKLERPLLQTTHNDITAKNKACASSSTKAIGPANCNMDKMQYKIRSITSWLPDSLIRAQVWFSLTARDVLRRRNQVNYFVRQAIAQPDLACERT